MRWMRAVSPTLVPLALAISSRALAAQATAPPVFRQDSTLRATAGENVPVSLDVPDRPHGEAFIVASPRDPRHLLAIAMAFTRPDTSSICAAFTSFDGGRTWRRSAALAGMERAEFGFDPWATFAPDGTAYASCLGAQLQPRTATMLVYRSPDGGRTWGRPMPLPHAGGGAFDRGVIAADSAGRVYASVSQSVMRDGVRHAPAVLGRIEPGDTVFAPPLRFMPDVLTRQVLDAEVLPDGAVAVALYDGSAAGARPPTVRMWVLVTRDGGRTLEPARYVTDLRRPAVTSAVLAADRSSGPHRGRLYLAWTDRDPERSDIVVSHSDDQGRTWSTPVRVNDRTGFFQHVNPSIEVNRDGVVGIVWSDRRTDRNGACSELYFAASRDGGESFGPNLRVSSVRSCPETPGNEVPVTGGARLNLGQRWAAGGDYSGLAAAADGRFHATWVDARTGRFQVWTSAITVTR
jgi:hypothetical protein